MALTYLEQLDSMYATTWALRWKEVVDQIHEATPFFYLLKKKGRVRTESGGSRIEVTLRYQKNETVQFIGKGGTVSIKGTDALTVAFYPWKYLTGHIVRYFADFQQNRSKRALIKKVNDDIDNLRTSMIDKLESCLFGDGTADDGKAIDGLGNLVATDPTSGTVANIDRASYTWWRNNAEDMSGKAASLYLLPRMGRMFNRCGRHGEGISRFPDLVVCSEDVYDLYENEVLEITRILQGDQKMVSLGFGELAYKGRPIVWSPSCPSGRLYMLNLNFIEWVVDEIENFRMGEWLPIVNQPRDRVAHIMTVCNLVMSNCARQGVLYNISA
ncbi:MAG: phage major capsid protein [Candidatus Coatesbacteria bacterium]|nr:MAG: phage major capsid protein [Candidatus Coatesbacteria bacterium]